jgi:hypothetical protein
MGERKPRQLCACVDVWEVYLQVGAAGVLRKTLDICQGLRNLPWTGAERPLEASLTPQREQETPGGGDRVVSSCGR